MASTDLSAFREEVRNFLSSALPAQTAARTKLGYHTSPEELREWQGILGEKGWLVRNWPIEEGGTGWSLMERQIFDEEHARAGAPYVPLAGIGMVGSLILNYGTKDQRDRFLPGIREGVAKWTQGWSESGAGSDLASLKCKATRVGDEYVINGTKMWMSSAHVSDWGMVLVRTSNEGRKHDGISILLVDLKSPGLTIRPIETADGSSYTTETFFDDVRVPAENLVGEENRGWPMMRGIVLDQERVAAAQLPICMALLDRIHVVAKQDIGDGAPLIETPSFRRRLGRLEIRMRSLHARMLEILLTPSSEWGVMPSVLKILGSRLSQDLSEMLSEAAGWYGIGFHKEKLSSGWGNEEPIGPEFATTAVSNFFVRRILTIAGGATEVQRNMIAKAVMG